MAQAESFDPFSDAALSKYLESVLEWHGYIRFLGLPHLRENPDVTIDRLYVEPNVAERWLSPDRPPAEWPSTVPAVKALIRHLHLILLGDPGSGKSTLVNWLACQLAFKSPGPVVQQIGRLLPLPMVVRELPVSRNTSWDGLVEAFLQRPVARPLKNRARVDELLGHGRVLVILDGLDELGNRELRNQLRAAVFEGMRRYPECRWVFTSRIVGYDDVPFHVEDDAGGQESVGADSQQRGRPELAAVRFVAPFNDEQIRRFAMNWFAQREAVMEKAQVDARTFLEAVSRDRATLRLARTPNLLTMMALIFRIRARLPHGRALLYNEITEAYLQSIDEFRKLTTATEYTGAQKRRWLSRVGFEMQLRRSDEANVGEGEPREVLVDETDVRQWISEAMSESGYGRDEGVASEFVDYIARRSGLLLPRGEGKFAFMHLSFQEYFAARFLEEQITSPLWLTTGEAAPGASKSELADHARQTTWRETFVFLFELLADRPGWPQAFAGALFGNNFEGLESNASATDVTALLAQLTVNPHSGFANATRAAACDACWRWEIAVQRATTYNPDHHRPAVAEILFSAEPDQIPDVWRSLMTAAQDTNILTLRGAPIANVSKLAKLISIERLDLSETPIPDIEPLAELQRLWWLSLNRTAIEDFQPLSRLPRLSNLSLGGTLIIDLGVLAELTGLRVLYLAGSPVSDLTSLANLTNLKALFIGRTKINSLSPLAHLTRLTVLSASNTGVSDLQPLSGLFSLNLLSLSGTRVEDLTPLAGLTKLRTLFLNRTRVEDVTPLIGLTGLRQLHLGDTRVMDLRPLADLPQLRIFR